MKVSNKKALELIPKTDKYDTFLEEKMNNNKIIKFEGELHRASLQFLKKKKWSFLLKSVLLWELFFGLGSTLFLIMRIYWMFFMVQVVPIVLLLIGLLQPIKIQNISISIEKENIKLVVNNEKKEKSMQYLISAIKRVEEYDDFYYLKLSGMSVSYLLCEKALLVCGTSDDVEHLFAKINKANK
ncbi:MAG: hypothetical protein IJF66_03470 [Clostridia bacterium]|nr:hypothetical protein [Clostridia bacterium]